MRKGIWEGFTLIKKGDSHHENGTLLFAWIKKVWHAITHGYGINKTNFDYKMSYRLVEKQELMDKTLWSSIGLNFGNKVSGNSLTEVMSQVS